MQCFVVLQCSNLWHIPVSGISPTQNSTNPGKYPHAKSHTNNQYFNMLQFFFYFCHNFFGFTFYGSFFYGMVAISFQVSTLQAFHVHGIKLNCLINTCICKSHHFIALLITKKYDFLSSIAKPVCIFFAKQ